MKQAVIGGKEGAGVVEVKDPQIADNYAKVKVFSAPLCTEFKGRGSENRAGLGHEAAGEVVEIGPNVRSVAVGDRVVVMPQNSCGICALCTSGEHIYCQSGRNALEICGSETGLYRVAQYTIQQDWLLVKIPDGMAYDHAVMACCGFGPAFNAMQSMEVTAGETVLVSGLGPVGLGAVTIALYRGARVLGLDTNAYRRNLAKQLGAEQVFNPADEDVKQQVLAATEGIGPHKSVDSSGAKSAAEFLVGMTRRRGRVAFIAGGDTINVGSMVWKGLRLYGCWHWNHLNDTERMMHTIAGSGKRIEQMITHRFPMDRIAEAIEVQAGGQCGKVIIQPWQG